MEQDKNRFWRTVRSAEKVIGPDLLNLYTELVHLLIHESEPIKWHLAALDTTCSYSALEGATESCIHAGTEFEGCSF